MNPALVTRSDVALHLEKLVAALGKKFGDADLGVEIDILHSALEDLPAIAVEVAIRHAVRTLERWPAPAKVRRLVLDTEEYKAWAVVNRGERADPNVLCPECGEAWTWHKVVKTERTISRHGRQQTQAAFVFWLDIVRHRPGCAYRASANTKRFDLYGYMWADEAGLEHAPLGVQPVATEEVQSA